MCHLRAIPLYILTMYFTLTATSFGWDVKARSPYELDVPLARTQQLMVHFVVKYIRVFEWCVKPLNPYDESAFHPYTISLSILTLYLAVEINNYRTNFHSIYFLSKYSTLNMTEKQRIYDLFYGIYFKIFS